METEKLQVRPGVRPSFKPEVTLVDSDEYEVAYGYSEILADHCIAERWKGDNWFHSHPVLTRGRLLSLLSTNMEGTQYDDLVDLGVKLGIMILRGDALEVQDLDMAVHVKHDPIMGTTPSRIL